MIKAENIKVEAHFGDFHTGTCENPGKMNEDCGDSKSVKDEPDPLEMLEENSENHFTCPECFKIFKRCQLMEIHIRRMHIGDLNFLCEMCPKRFHSKSEKDSHFEFIHSIERKFKCTKCEKRFKKRGDVNKHFKAVHLKEKPYTCKFCDCIFAQISNMNFHIRRYHKDSWESRKTSEGT